MKVRRNIASFSQSEKERLDAALEAIQRSGRFQELLRYHGDPPMCIGLEGVGRDGWCCAHDNPRFLPWHRLFTVQIEEMLGEPLPYWNWAEERDLPDFWLQGPLHRDVNYRPPPGCERESQGTTRRNSSRVGDHLNDMMEVYERNNYGGFNAQMKRPHDSVHVEIGCNMGDVGTASYDPLFFLHHAFVDYQFAFWQELQRLRGREQFDREDPELQINMEPFSSLCSEENTCVDSTRENSRGVDTFDYENNFCYRYDNLLFRGQTPRQFLESLGVAEQEERLEFAVVTNPDATDRTFTNTIDVCRGSDCVEAGKFNNFGSIVEGEQRQIGRSGRRQDNDQSGDRETYPVYTDVTEIVKNKGWSLDDKRIIFVSKGVKDYYGKDVKNSGCYDPMRVYKAPGTKNITLGIPYKNDGEVTQDLGDCHFDRPVDVEVMYVDNSGNDYEDVSGPILEPTTINPGENITISQPGVIGITIVVDP